MRKVSPKLPIWITVFAFISPFFYIVFYISKSGFSLNELLKKLTGGLIIAALVWSVYGIICLLMPKKKTDIILAKKHDSSS
jgi:ABC-type long-subunit fatty acid transport system fused permease/ATPase subunit